MGEERAMGLHVVEKKAIILGAMGRETPPSYVIFAEGMVREGHDPLALREKEEFFDAHPE